MAATVFIVDHDPAMRQSLARLVESVNLPVEAYESAISFLNRHEPERPGCLISEVRIPGMSGLELQEQLRAVGSKIPIIFVTGFADVPSAVRAIKGGAIDFLEKPVADHVLVENVRRAIARDAEVRQSRSESERVRQRLGLLTRREQEVMSLVVEGHSSKEIAGQLDVSFKTVEAHRAKIMRKMEAKSVPHLIRMTLQRARGTSAASQDTDGRL
jgi:two-component system, LuxR family, response regulator FixJ